MTLKEISPAELIPGNLYLWGQLDGRYGSDRNYVQKVVLCVSVEVVKPIYTKYNLLILDTNQSEKTICDKFGKDNFLRNFTEITDEAQIEKARKGLERK